MSSLEYKTTAEIKVPEKLIDWIIGQDNGVNIIRKAASQRRNVLLMGQPGTGKSMLAQAMAELMPAEDLEDVLCYPNTMDENHPVIRVVKTYPKDEKQMVVKMDAPARMGHLKAKPDSAGEKGEKSEKTENKKMQDVGQGRLIVEQERMRARLSARSGISPGMMLIGLALIFILILSFSGWSLGEENKYLLPATVIALSFIIAAMIFSSQISRRAGFFESAETKLIVDNSGKKTAPFVDATGAKAGSLFGDVKHDPLQCIPQGECILYADGNVVPIEQIVDKYFIGEETGEKKIETPEFVLGGADEEYKIQKTRVLRVFKRRYTDDLIKVKTRSGCVARVTPNHPFAVLGDDGKIEYVEAGRVSPSLRVAIPEKIPENGCSKISLEMVRFVADVLADGAISSRRVDFKLKRDFKIKQIAEDINAIGYAPRIREYKGATIVSVNSAELVRKLELELGIRDQKTRTKLIPSEIFNSSPEVMDEFLAHILSLDGYINPQGQFEILSSNKRFLQQLRSLLFKRGMNAKYSTRKDTGYGRAKGKIQHRLRWNHFEWAKKYAELTFNPIHKKNLSEYLENCTFNKECFDDVMPLSYSKLEQIRFTAGVSKEKVHPDYWSVNTALPDPTRLTRGLLQKVVLRFKQMVPEDVRVEEISRLAFGEYAFDEIVSIEREPFEGFVYNLTTETGNYFVDFALTHNTGGLGTPAHLRVESGAIHRANKGVLFLDEVSSLGPKSQQELLTAMQDKKYPITGQSEMSSGAIVRTEPVPCDFVLVAAGNLIDMQNMHPALRSRIRGYGYEIYMEDSMPDNEENCRKLMQFVAQEVTKDGKIPHFERAAVDSIIDEARRKAGRKKRLTLKLRELGGIVRAAGDVAKEEGASFVTKQHVEKAKKLASTLEQQVSQQIIDLKKDYKVFNMSGYAVGKVNGLAVMGDGSSGLIMPIVSEVTPSSSKSEGKLIATGKLGEIAKEAVENVSAVIKKHIGRDVSMYDIHVQFLQTYEGVEGDSASISVAVAVISAMEGIPIDQSAAMTGSLSVRGEVLPVGGVTAKVEAAIEAGARKVLIPSANAGDVYLDADKRKKIEIVPVSTIVDVLEHALKEGDRKKKLVKEMKKAMHSLPY